jgi:alpha-tubulin suppressor-like RCC1 family protein
VTICNHFVIHVARWVFLASILITAPIWGQAPASLTSADWQLVPLTDVVQVATGGDHTCALSTTGGVKCWGSNINGQLGDGSTMDRLKPVDVVGLSSGVQAISAGNFHTCALTTGGGVKCWGSGQLGDGSTSQRTTPIDVVGLSNGVQAISAGDAHTCALSTGGGVQCWGNNINGQLGDGSISTRLTPVDVAGLGSGVQAISAGGAHTCALTTGGGITCWGANGNGQLGDNSITQRLVPVDVEDLGSGVHSISAGSHHTCALTTDGGVKCWGWNLSGQLGDGSVTQRLTAVDVVGLGSGAQIVSAGRSHTCALTTGGEVMCWGLNGAGQLGDGTSSVRLTPVDVVGLTSDVQTISANSFHTCGVSADGGVSCWGLNFNGQLGDGSTTARLVPVDVVGLGSGVQSISAGFRHTCALDAGGAATCWGRGFNGQLGDGSVTSRRLEPVGVVGLGSGVQAISSGGNHTCALTVGGGVTCWGLNLYGQLGDDSTLRRLTPVDVVDLGSGVQAIDVGHNHSCALTTVGGVRCWGRNLQGELGDDSTTQRLTPVEVFGLGSGVQAISAGQLHTCALTTGGGVKCWGSNSNGQLGDGTTTQRLTPVDVAGLGSGVQAISAGQLHTCALTTEGEVKCWGVNAGGQLGDSSTMQRLTPVEVVDLGSVQAISAGGAHTCALTTGGGISCWGSNLDGRLGDGSTTLRLTPVNVVGFSSGVQAISTGDAHTCALTTGGGAKCWGGNNEGQLGDGTFNGVPLPQTVLVNPRPLELSIIPTTMLDGQSSSITVQGGFGTGEVSVAISTGSEFCSLAGMSLTALAVGECTVTASKAEDGEFAEQADSVLVRVVSDSGVNLATEIQALADDGQRQARGQCDAVSYRIRVRNNGPLAADQVRVEMPAPTGLLAPVEWTCTVPDAACSPASGHGMVDVSFPLAIGESAEIDISACPDPNAAFADFRIQASLPDGMPLLFPEEAQLNWYAPINDDGLFRNRFQ